ncbi:MAG: hypothetical protein AVDCRST_MAG40-237, partial [uncultured Gemmatimonadaceae bacterium]
DDRDRSVRRPHRGRGPPDCGRAPPPSPPARPRARGRRLVLGALPAVLRGAGVRELRGGAARARREPPGGRAGPRVDGRLRAGRARRGGRARRAAGGGGPLDGRARRAEGGRSGRGAGGGAHLLGPAARDSPLHGGAGAAAAQARAGDARVAADRGRPRRPRRPHLQPRARGRAGGAVRPARARERARGARALAERGAGGRRARALPGALGERRRRPVRAARRGAAHRAQVRGRLPGVRGARPFHDLGTGVGAAGRGDRAVDGAGRRPDM